MMAGKYTYNDCIDIDSHELIGWNSVPTRWHPKHLGEVLPGPISWRAVPVIRPSLRFFQIAKVVHDNFPNRIWTFFKCKSWTGRLEDLLQKATFRCAASQMHDSVSTSWPARKARTLSSTARIAEQFWKVPPTTLRYGFRHHHAERRDS